MTYLTRILIVMLATFAGTTAVQAADSTVTVNGKVVAGACTVNPTLVAGKTVDLGNLGTTKFQRAGEADSTWHNFSLELSDCPGWVASSTVTITGTPAVGDATLFANAEPAATAAKNIAVELSKQSDNSAILSNGDTMTVNADTVAKTVSFPLAARMKTPTGNGQAGKLTASIVVDFTYQ